MDFTLLINELTAGIRAFGWQNLVMLAVGCILIYLAIAKEYEPNLLLPIGFGCILANLGMGVESGFMKVIYDAGITTELFPLLIFVGVGAMIDAIMKSPEPITVICICPMPNMMEALKREPRIAQKARFVGMHGSIRKGYGKPQPDAEWNVKANPKACQ